MTDIQKKDLIDIVIPATLSVLSGNAEAMDYFIDAACIRAISNDAHDIETHVLAMHQSVLDLGKVISLIADDVSEFCLEMFDCIVKEDK
ncbi:MAG: hypothetical protein K2N81_12170 [Acetatifactor sp.]|nr:hypothetical protein [Acetatifactor sp.]